jgi:hypothetical protein
VTDVGAEDAAEGVELVDDDVAQPQEEGRPPLVVREEAQLRWSGVQSPS